MTNLIKAPIQKIRRKGPNGEYTIHWDEIVEDIVKSLEEGAGLDMGSDNWQLINGFHHFPALETLSEVANISYKNDYVIAIVCVHECGELKWFSLARLMPELECW